MIKRKNCLTPHRTMLWTFIYLLILALPAAAQPSGGPYGPIDQVYEIPVIDGTIYYVAPDGSAGDSGTSVDRPTTIEEAIKHVVTGDAIIMRGGIYRTGNLILNQGILIQPYLDEKPVMMGTYVATEWEPLRDGIWAASWNRLFPDEPQPWWRYEREAMRTPLHKFNNDMVFVDDKYLKSAGWMGEVDENTFYIDYERERVYIGIDPTDRVVEITAYDVAIHRTTDEVHGKVSDGRGFTMRGITLTKYAYRIFEIDGKDPEGISDEADHGKDVIGITLEHLDMSYGSRVAGYFRGDSLVIRHCRVSDTNTEGIFILSSNDVLLEKNIFTRNNIENMTGYYPAAVKIFNQCYRVTCRDNLVIDHPNSNGIWYDVGNVDGVFIDNWVEGVGQPDRQFDPHGIWPSTQGFFFEISKGAIVAGNVFVDNDNGVMVLNSSDVHIYQNTFINSSASIARTPRSAVGDHFDWHPATGPDVDERYGHIFMNNLMVGTKGYDRPLLALWQTPDLCDRLKESQLDGIDHNVYVRGTDKVRTPLIVWSPAVGENCLAVFNTIEEFRRAYPEYEKNGKYLPDYAGPLFRSVKLRNIELLPGFPGFEAAMELPEDIGKLLRLHKPGEPYIGAYPPKP